ncbi:hypothetical protein ACKFKF_24575 [Phormidesmis sp. 146-12]
MIVDNLDRIVPSSRGEGRTNHDEIFIDRSGQLRKLNCHVIYTVPISLVYSNRASVLRDNYGECQVLPMLMVYQRNGNNYADGIAKVKELIHQRIAQFAQNVSLEQDIFDSAGTIEQLCLMSGGHLRELMQLIQGSLDWTDTLPISASALRRAIGRARSTYRDAVDEPDWEKLAAVFKSKQIVNDDDYRNLLFKRCVLEYRYTDDQGEPVRWHDIHPLLRGVEELQRYP